MSKCDLLCGDRRMLHNGSSMMQGKENSPGSAATSTSRQKDAGATPVKSADAGKLAVGAWLLTGHGAEGCD